MPKRWCPRSRSPAPSPRAAPQLAAQCAVGPDGLLGANPNPRSAPQGPLRRVLVPLRQGSGSPSPKARLTLPQRCHLGREGRRRSFRAGELTGPWRNRRHLKPPTPKCRGPQSRTPAPLPRPAHLSPPSQRIWPAGLMGANSNPGSAHEEPLPRGLAPQRRGLGIPEPQPGIHPAAPPPTEPLGALLGIQGRRKGRALRAMATFKGPGHQNAGAHTPARHRPQLGLHLHSSHSRRIGPAGLLGAKPKPRTAPSVAS